MSRRRPPDERPQAKPNDEADNLVAAGWWGEVRYARRLNGIMEAREWLENANLSVQSKFDHLFRRMAESGIVSNKEQFRKLQGNIWEFKRAGDRIPCFQCNMVWFLTHHFCKGANTNREIFRAERIRAEHLEHWN